MNTTKQVLLTVILVISSVGLGFLAFAEPSAPIDTYISAESPTTVAPLVTNDNVETVSETVIVAKRPVIRTAQKATTWSCGAPRALHQGPVNVTVRDCTWN